MPRPWRIRFAGARYHVTVRGNGRQVIFHWPEDYDRYLEQLASALELDQVVLYAYALLRNHLHLLVETPLGNIDRFMQRVNTAYGMYHRYKQNRPGHCLQGRYGAKLVGGDEYTLRVTRYIHLNPVKTKRFKSMPEEEKLKCLNEYRWSSYPGYVNTSKQREMVDYRWLKLMERRSMAGRQQAYRTYVESFVNDDDDALKDAMTASRYAIGEEEFRTKVDEELQEARLRKGIYGDIVWPEGRQIAVEEIVDRVAAEFRIEPDELRTHGRRAGVAKKVALELSCQLSGMSQRGVGEHFGYKGNGAVGKQRARIRDLVSADKALNRRMLKLRKQLSSK